jgi:hypothetical protein
MKVKESVMIRSPESWKPCAHNHFTSDAYINVYRSTVAMTGHTFP